MTDCQVGMEVCFLESLCKYSLQKGFCETFELASIAHVLNIIIRKKWQASFQKDFLDIKAKLSFYQNKSIIFNFTVG